jgi:hypothetical protein
LDPFGSTSILIYIKVYYINSSGVRASSVDKSLLFSIKDSTVQALAFTGQTLPQAPQSMHKFGLDLKSTSIASTGQTTIHFPHLIQKGIRGSQQVWHPIFIGPITFWFYA